MANVVKNPKAALEPHDSDIHLSNKQYLKLSLFAQLKKPPTLDKFPGTIVVRRYRKGEELFRQGESGWTAFYILTLADVLAVRQAQLETASRENERIALQLEINRLAQEQSRRQTLPEDHPSLQAATVHMATLRKDHAPSSAGVARLLNFKSRPLDRIKNREEQTVFIPVGGPQTISYDAGRAPLFEGDLFGEMCCLYRTPRSATVVADRDVYMIEFLRNILESVYRDPAFKARADQIFTKRVLELHLRKMPLFRDLDDAGFKLIAQNIELVSYEPGALVCDEHERSDCMYLVRNGLVKIMKNVSYLLGPADITDWSALADALKRAATAPATPQGKFWSLLPPRAQALLLGNDVARLNPADRAEVLFSLNDTLKNPKLCDAPEVKSVLDGESFRAQVKLPAQRKDWTDAHVRQVNRLLAETLFPTGVRKHRLHAGIETILAYASAGDYFGEMGLMLNQPRSASCIAFSHPNFEGSTDLVRIPAKAFWQLMKMSAPIRERVREEIANRRKQNIAQLAKPVWIESNQVQNSEKFAELGLIQGQQLMLIDLDRCTRCDECVRACVDTHADGHSRLFLDGPRFGKYLVPTTCRSCLDPVCMINCPVASIHRGDNREIIIEDWCIGCRACAESCPYGSIQMYDQGLVPEEQGGWRFLPAGARAAQGDWMKPGFNDSAWLTGESPFRWNRRLMEAMVPHLPGSGGTQEQKTLCFRFAFSLSRGQLRPDATFKIELNSLGSGVKVWLNGRELVLDDRVKRGRHEYSVPPPARDKAERKKAADFLAAGRNVVAVQVTPTAKPGEVLMQLRLDEQKKPKKLPAEVEDSVADEVVEKLVTHRAVVCDLCSSLPGQSPACVRACPHDAALRVDARFNFPKN